MAKGPSGRVVVELDPALKRELHAALAAQGWCLKDWFIKQAREYVAERQQPPLPGITLYPAHSEPMMLAAEEPAPYKTQTEPKT